VSVYGEDLMAVVSRPLSLVPACCTGGRRDGCAPIWVVGSVVRGILDA
jgi:hypothetical protein